MVEEDPTLYVLTSVFMLAEGAILWTQKLSTFGKGFLASSIIMGGLTLIGAWKDIDWILRLSHAVFVSLLVLGSIFAQNKYILLLLALVIVVSRSVGLYQNRCAYHAHIRKLECSPEHYYAGCFPAKVIYVAVLVTIVTRYFMGNIR